MPNNTNNSFFDHSLSLFEHANSLKYCYQFSWFGIPVIQYPHDLLTIQQLLWSIKPQFVIETGTAHGGLSSYLASIMHGMDSSLPLHSNKRRVITIEIEMRESNFERLKKFPYFDYITVVEGSSVDLSVFDEVQSIISDNSCIVLLDSSREESHVLRELELYSQLVSVNSCIVVFGTCIEYLSPGSWPDRPWDVGSSAGSAVSKWLVDHPDFIQSRDYDKIGMSSFYNGILFKRNL